MNEPKATCTNSDELVMRFMALFSWVHVCVCVLANETDNTTLTENKNINYRLKRYFQRQIAVLN